MAIAEDSPQVSKGWKELTVYLGKVAPKRLRATIAASQAMMAATSTNARRK